MICENCGTEVEKYPCVLCGKGATFYGKESTKFYDNALKKAHKELGHYPIKQTIVYGDFYYKATIQNSINAKKIKGRGDSKCL